MQHRALHGRRGAPAAQLDMRQGVGQAQAGTAPSPATWPVAPAGEAAGEDAHVSVSRFSTAWPVARMLSSVVDGLKGMSSDLARPGSARPWARYGRPAVRGHGVVTTGLRIMGRCPASLRFRSAVARGPRLGVVSIRATRRSGRRRRARRRSPSRRGWSCT